MIAPTSFFADYGCHIRIWQEAKALQKLGHRVVITTYHNGDDMPGVEIRRSWDVPWLKRAMVGSSRHKIYLDAALSYRALETGRRLRPTIIHAHLHEGALIGAVLKRILRVPLVFDFQGSMTSEMIDHHFLSGKDSRAYTMLRRLEQAINTQADALITSSENAAELLRRDFRFPNDRLYTVADGINTDRFRPLAETPAWQAERAALRAEPADTAAASTALASIRSTLTPYTVDSSYSALDAALIILREGLEALLVVVALLAFLRKSGNSDKRGWIWAGAGLGVLASIGAALALQAIFSTVSAGRNRELIEGITGLVAAALLFYVSYWLHSKASLGAWKKYIDARTTQALARGSMLGLALLRQAFGAFYARGLRTVGLGVDAQNLSGATRLYERAGMVVAERYDHKEKQIGREADK